MYTAAGSQQSTKLLNPATKKPCNLNPHRASQKGLGFRVSGLGFGV